MKQPLFTVKEEAKFTKAIVKYEKALIRLRNIEPNTERINRQITLKDAKVKALKDIQGFRFESAEALCKHLEIYTLDHPAMQGHLPFGTRHLIEDLRQTYQRPGRITLSHEVIDDLFKSYCTTVGATHASTNENTVNLLPYLDPDVFNTLEDRNAAIDTYLANADNQQEPLYHLLQLFKKPAPAQNHLFEEAFKLGRWFVKPDPSDQLPLEQLAKTTEAGNKPIIAGLSAWQLCHFFDEATKSTIIQNARTLYKSENSSRHKNNASQQLSERLAGEEAVDAKWHALLAYCCDSDNYRGAVKLPRRLLKIIITQLQQSIYQRCLDAYTEACNRLRQEPQTLANATEALLLLTAIPTTDTRKDSPFGRSAIFAALSECHQRLANYPLAFQLCEMAQTHTQKETPKAWGPAGWDMYYRNFPTEAHVRKAELLTLMVAHQTNQSYLGREADTRARRRFHIFAHSISKAMHAAVPIKVVAYGVDGAAIIAPSIAVAAPFAPVILQAAIVMTAIACCVAVGGAIHGAVHACSRDPLDAAGYKELGKLLDYFQDTPQSQKANLIGIICSRYKMTKMSSDSSKELVVLLQSANEPAMKWNHLRVFLFDNKNNGKSLFLLIRDVMREKWKELKRVDESEEDQEAGVAHRLL